MTRRRGIRPKTLVTIAVVSVATVVAYDWYKHNTSGPVGGARPPGYAGPST